MILGISPGTRLVGTAILKDGVLIDWGVKMFKEKWSDQKLQRIVTVLEAIIRRYGIKTIALKSVHISKASKELEVLVHAIVLVARQLKIHLRTYTIEELKHHCNGAPNKELIMSYVFQLYPEVEKTIRFGKENSLYHMKTIEAVALVHSINE